MTRMISSSCAHLEDYPVIGVCSEEVVQPFTHDLFVP